jgi:hypothetical protein
VTKPIRRKVALKILKAGIDTRQVIARFEAERQALALMDHPNIAHVMEGGEPVGRLRHQTVSLTRMPRLTRPMVRQWAVSGTRLASLAPLS